MNERQLQFRTATFGGFQKSDVLEYLEKSAKEHAEAVAALERELSEARDGRTAGEGKCAQLEQRLEQMEAERQQLREELSQTAADRARLEEQTRQLQAEVERLRPASAAYERIKDRTARIELEAYSRAQEIERTAREKGKKTQGQMLEWMEKVMASYARIREELDASMERAAQELGQASGQLQEVSGQLLSYDEALRGLKGQTESLGGLKPPAPLPVEEEL